MRPTTSREFRELVPMFGATCTKGSLMFGVSKLLAELANGEEITPFSATISAMQPLVKRANTHGGVLTLEVMCEYFASVEHYQHIQDIGTIIGNEIELDPPELRPLLHTLLPLDYDGIYRNAGVEIEILNLIEMGEASGLGFWAAHMAGKIWIPRGQSFRERLLAAQADSPEFVRALHSVANTRPVVDFYEYRRLLRQTDEAKEEMTM